jgi:hypothetical protein
MFSEYDFQEGQGQPTVRVEDEPDYTGAIVYINVNVWQSSSRPLTELELVLNRPDFDERGKSESRFEDRSGTVMSRLLTVGGTASTIAGYNSVSPFSGAWRGANGLRYAAGHHPNGATEPLSLAKRNAAAWARLGKVLGAAGYVYGGFQTVNAYRQGGATAAIKPGVDTLFGIASTHGGVPGLVVGGIYFGVDATIGWDQVGHNLATMPRRDQGKNDNG